MCCSWPRDGRRWVGVLAGVLLAGSAHGQLAVGNDTTEGNLWVIDLNGGVNTRRLLPANSTDAQVNAIAADPAGNFLYWIDSGSRLMRAPMTTSGFLTPEFRANTTVSGVTTTFQGLAFDTVANQLVGYRATGTIGFYTINVTTGIATLQGNIAGDYGGFDFDPGSNTFIACNDATTGPGRGIVRITRPLSSPTATLLTTWPNSDSDVDGCAVGGGRVYGVNDSATQGVYVYNLATSAFEPTITLPYTDPAGVFAGATWAPQLLGSGGGVDLGVTISDPPDCTVALGQNIDYTINVINGDVVQPSNGVEVRVPLPSGVQYVSSTPSGSVSGGAVRVILGTVAQNSTTTVQLALRSTQQQVVNVSAIVSATTPDPNTSNNTALASTSLVPVQPMTAAARGVLSTIASASNSSVPGIAGTRFSNTIPPGRPFMSGDRTRILMSWDTTFDNTGQDQVLVALSSGLATVVAREGVTVLPTQQGPIEPDLPPYFPFAFDAVMGVNSDGAVAYSGVDDRSTLGNDGFVVKTTTSGLALVLQEGLTPVPFSGGVLFGTARANVGITSSGVTNFYSDLTGGGVTAATNAALFADDGLTVLAQKGVTLPSGQPGAPVAYSGFSTGPALGMAMDAAGNNWICKATIDSGGLTDDVVVRNNAIVAREGSVLPNSTFSSLVSGTFRAVRMEPDSTWFVSGANLDGTDWVVRNGTVVASTDQAMVAGSTELWDDATLPGTFFLMAGNGRGDYVVGGTTNAIDTRANAVIAWNGQQVLLRENDPVDVNNNGVFDDQLYIGAFLDDRVVMNDQELFAVVRLRSFAAAACNGPDVDAGVALVRVPLPVVGTQCDGIDFNNDGLFPDTLDIDDFLSVFTGGACSTGTCGDIDFNNDTLFPDTLDIDSFLSVFAGGACL
jgi:uncharacterized repeat protein (TIGR01451 family)